MGITVRQFFEGGKHTLSLGIEAGEAHLDREIGELAINRPGLALAGFFNYFAMHRVQVLGLAEQSYLRSLSAHEQEKRLRDIFRRKIPAVILTRNRRASHLMKQMAERHRVPVLRSPLVTGRAMNAATVLLESLAAPKVRVHGTMIDILGVGVLLEGPPGIGKSETALTLIERGHSLVADDITVLQRVGEDAIQATSVEITRYHMEIRGLGIIHVPSLFGVASMRSSAGLDLIVRLERPGPQMEQDRSGLTPQSRDVLGVRIPLVTLPVAAGRDLAHVIEVAALNQRLKDLGHDAAKELDEKMISMLTRKRG